MANYKDGPDAIAQYIRDHHDLSENGENVHGFIFFDRDRDVVHSEVAGDLVKIIVDEESMDELMQDLDNTAMLYDAVAVGIFVRHHDPEDHDAYACQAEQILLDAIDDLTDHLKGIFVMGLSTRTDEYDLKFSTADTLNYMKKMLREIGGGSSVGDMLDALMGKSNMGNVDNLNRSLLEEVLPEGVTMEQVNPNVFRKATIEAQQKYEYVYGKDVPESERYRRFAEVQTEAIDGIKEGMAKRGYADDRHDWPPAITASVADLESLVSEVLASGQMPDKARMDLSIEIQKAALTERLALSAEEEGIIKPTAKPTVLDLGSVFDQMKRRVPAPPSIFDVPALDLLGSPITDDKPQ